MLLNLFGYLGDGRAPLVEVLRVFCTSKSSTSFPSSHIENQGKISQKWEYFSFFEVFF